MEEHNIKFTKKQLELIKEANSILVKLARSRIGIVAIDGSFNFFNTKIWDIDSVDLDCGFSGFSVIKRGDKESLNDHLVPLTTKIECQH